MFQDSLNDWFLYQACWPEWVEYQVDCPECNLLLNISVDLNAAYQTFVCENCNCNFTCDVSE